MKLKVIVNWTGTFEYKPGLKEVRIEKDTLVFNHIPTETEIVDEFKLYQNNILTRSDWTDIKITSYVIPVETTTSIVIK